MESGRPRLQNAGSSTPAPPGRLRGGTRAAGSCRKVLGARAVAGSPGSRHGSGGAGRHFLRRHELVLGKVPESALPWRLPREPVGGGGRPGVSARACVGVVPTPGASRALRRFTAEVWRCRRIGGFYLRVKNRPRSFEGLLKLAVCLDVQVLESETCEFTAYLRRSPRL